MAQARGVARLPGRYQGRASLTIRGLLSWVCKLCTTYTIEVFGYFPCALPSACPHCSGGRHGTGLAPEIVEVTHIAAVAGIGARDPLLGTGILGFWRATGFVTRSKMGRGLRSVNQYSSGIAPGESGELTPDEDE
jgi:hypothetical protein